MTGDMRGKPTDFQEEGLGLFRLFISTVLGWPSLLSFGSPSGLDGRPSHGQSRVNRGEGRCWLSGFLLMELAEQLSKMLHCLG